ncbi:hypothetical protein [Arachidicoccus soli]|uniref:Uncharacterized protein n=1 Tax=Arachidicoccus soli TaxID=2341117 RepID=A0A386HL71_9BACT|nr:hypothetical protein [Arachidicoccus soli]AYD46493.1 hypothetical protein D6B99_02000 [Arachidicoccus soli]
MSEIIPNKILQSSEKENAAFPLLSGKNTPEGKTFIYLSKDYACQQPVESVEEILMLLNK